jgi:hypothetical protein
MKNTHEEQLWNFVPYYIKINLVKFEEEPSKGKIQKQDTAKSAIIASSNNALFDLMRIVQR